MEREPQTKNPKNMMAEWLPTYPGRYMARYYHYIPAIFLGLPVLGYPLKSLRMCSFRIGVQDLVFSCTA